MGEGEGPREREPSEATASSSRSGEADRPPTTSAASAASPGPAAASQPGYGLKGQFGPRLCLLLSCLQLVCRASSTDACLARTQQGCEGLAPSCSEQSRLCLSPALGFSPRELFSAMRAERHGLMPHGSTSFQWPEKGQ